jgi:hypothetical protein
MLQNKRKRTQAEQNLTIQSKRTQIEQNITTRNLKTQSNRTKVREHKKVTEHNQSKI